MKLKRGDLLIGLDKLRDDIKTLAGDCNESGFLNERNKLFDAWTVIDNIRQAAMKDNYNFDNEIESSTIKSAKSEFGYDAHETMTFDEFKNFVKSVVEPVEMFDYKSAYFVILNNEDDCKKLQQKLDDTYGVDCTYYLLQDSNNEYHSKWQLMA